jgi:hypothetical protein
LDDPGVEVVKKEVEEEVEKEVEAGSWAMLRERS